jgi:5-methylcytosine-specific restriction enzyme A
MAFRPPVGCNFPACKAISLPGKGYCKDHQNVPREMARVRDRERYARNPWRKWYNSPGWRDNIKPKRLKENPICQVCNREGSYVVDHIVDHHGDWNLFFDYSNTRALCRPCHDKKLKPHIGAVLKPAGPAATGAPGEQFAASSDNKALDDYMAHYHDEDLDDVKIPE